MITKHEILEALQETDDDWDENFQEGGVLYGIDPTEDNEILEQLKSIDFTMNEVYDIFYFLDVEDIDERLEWYNHSELNLEDIERLANMEFYATECEGCSEMLYEGGPNNWTGFHRVLDRQICHVDGELNGSLIDIDFCEDCYQKAKVLLGF